MARLETRDELDGKTQATPRNTESNTPKQLLQAPTRSAKKSKRSNQTRISQENFLMQFYIPPLAIALLPKKIDNIPVSLIKTYAEQINRQATINEFVLIIFCFDLPQRIASRLILIYHFEFD